MPKLTDTQLIVLSKAAARSDGVAAMPTGMNKAAASRVGASLVARKLMREIRSKANLPVWHENEGRSTSLIITRAGRNAIAIEDEEESVEPRDDGTRGGTGLTMADAVAAPRPGSKQALLIELMSSKKGATLERLVEATGWLPHTTRASLTSLRKRGFAIERSREEGESSIYRIVSGKA